MVIKEFNVNDIREEVTSVLTQGLQSIYNKYNVADYNIDNVSVYVKDIADLIAKSVNNTNKELPYNLKSNSPSLKLKLRQYYIKTYPTDDLAEEIPAFATFEGLLNTLNNGQKDVVNYLCAEDSVVRERLFKKLAKILNVNYDVLYKNFLELK